MVFLAVVLVVVGFYFWMQPKFYLVLISDDQVMKKIALQPGDRFTISFVHSSELHRWDDIFTINGQGKIVLEKMIMPSTGPGTPTVLDPGWRFKIENGNFVYYDIDKTYNRLVYKVSSISPHYLTVHGQTVNLVDLVGDWQNVTLTVVRSIF